MTKPSYTYNPQHFESVLSSVQSCMAKTPKKAVAHLEQKVIAYLDAKVSQTAGADKKLFEKCHNYVTSYVEGLKGGDIELKDLKTLRRDLESARKAHEEAAAEAAARAAAKKAKAQEETGGPVGPPDDHEDPEWLAEWLKGQQGFDAGEGAEKIFRKYAKYRKEMPNSLAPKKPYIAVRMPIVVIPNGIPDQFKMARTGLVEDMLFGNPVLKNQILIGLNYNWLADNFAKKAKNSVIDKSKAPMMKDINLDYEKAIELVLAEVKSRTGRSHVAMPGVHGFDSTNLHWMWVASSLELSKLNGTTNMGTFSVKDWTLPFPHQVRKMKAPKK